MENKRFNLLTGLAILLVLLIYVWFIKLGGWHTRGTSDYYSRLAISFQHRQLELEEKPDPALLALTNPYDQKARKNIHVVGDASLYQGKYYLYFGPFPSLALAALASLLPVKPGDQFFVYLFTACLFLVQCLLFRDIVHRFFPNVEWILPLGVLILGLTGPYTRMMAHPFIHEAALAGGQMLFMTGFYFAFLSLKEKPTNRGKLLLASTFWAAAIATRTTQLAQVGFMVLLTWLYIYYEYRRLEQNEGIGSLTITLIAPLLICGGLLAWYNWARFGSIFEFGLYYQLAAFNLQANYSILFSRVYFLQNIYNYFLNPFEITGKFPFFFPQPGMEKALLASQPLPNIYAVEGKFPGVLYSTPFLLLAILPVFFLVKGLLFQRRSLNKTNELFHLLDWTVVGLFGSFIASCILVLLYFYVGLRFETEFISCLTLLALIGFCQGYATIKSTTTRRIYSVVCVVLGLVSISLNLALAYAGVAL